MCLPALVCLSLFGACVSPSVPAQDSRQLRVVVTIFPAYDWTREILGAEADHMDLELLVKNGVDLHSFQPSVSDIVSISGCDVLIYVGGESDRWIADALKQSARSEQTVISLLDLLGDRLKTEETVEGMQSEQEEDEAGYDEHVWLSLKNASFLTKGIAETFARIDPAHADTYLKNAEAYAEKLDALDRSYAETVQNAKHRTMVFGDRFPFRYLADDYGLAYYAAFSGCSAETEASFDTIVFLAGKLDELELKTILQLESANGSIAEAVRNATVSKDQRILSIDSLQSLTEDEIRSGATYLKRMESDLAVLNDALN